MSLEGGTFSEFFGGRISVFLSLPSSARPGGSPLAAAAAASKEVKWLCGRNIFRRTHFFLPLTLVQTGEVGRSTLRARPEEGRPQSSRTAALRPPGKRLRVCVSLVAALLQALPLGNEGIKPSLLCSPFHSVVSPGGAHLCPHGPTDTSPLCSDTLLAMRPPSALGSSVEIGANKRTRFLRHL